MCLMHFHFVDCFLLSNPQLLWTIHIILASCVKSLTIGVPTSTAFSKPVITPEEKVCHPRPNTANMITINKMKPNKPILNLYTKTSYKIYIIFVIEECTSRYSAALWNYNLFISWPYTASTTLLFRLRVYLKLFIINSCLKVRQLSSIKNFTVVLNLR